jgi:hypothetical protein
MRINIFSATGVCCACCVWWDVHAIFARLLSQLSDKKLMWPVLQGLLGEGAEDAEGAEDEDEEEEINLHAAASDGERLFPKNIYLCLGVDACVYVKVASGLQACSCRGWVCVLEGQVVGPAWNGLWTPSCTEAVLGHWVALKACSKWVCCAIGSRHACASCLDLHRLHGSPAWNGGMD